MDGQSLVAALSGKPQPQPKYLYWEFHEGGGKQAVRMGNWKAIKLNVTVNNNTPTELYNLKDDPSEQNNVAAKNVIIVKQMEAMMKEAYVPNKDWPLLAGEGK
jgi:arylsulfatase A-like enzyme